MLMMKTEIDVDDENRNREQASKQAS